MHVHCKPGFIQDFNLRDSGGGGGGEGSGGVPPRKFNYHLVVTIAFSMYNIKQLYMYRVS